MQIYEIDKEDFLPIDIEVENAFSIGLLTGKSLWMQNGFVWKFLFRAVMTAIYGLSGLKTWH